MPDRVLSAEEVAAMESTVREGFRDAGPHINAVSSLARSHEALRGLLADVCAMYRPGVYPPAVEAAIQALEPENA